MYTLTEAWPHLTTTTVAPRYPAATVSAVFNPVALGELVAHAIGVASLSAHKSDEVQGAKVNLQELLQTVGLRNNIRAPGPITIIKVQSVIRERTVCLVPSI